MGRNQQSKCDYCGGIVGDDWVKGDYRLFCSTDCRYARRLWNWVCMLLLIIPISVVLWTSYSYNPEILPVLFVLLLIIFYIILEVLQGIRARRRIAEKRKFRETDQ